MLCLKLNMIFMLFFAELLYVTASTKQNGPIVTVKEGKVRGSLGTLFDGSIFYSFKGIPFASPPVADLRFKAPIPPSSWIGIREATNFGPICTQYTSNATYQGTQGQEDCLYLNVYTKSLNENAKTPVMVYIYGGSFTEGSANTYGPQFLIQHDIILVTFNYRLEVLGFLSLDTPEVPGNAAMKDQVAALKWVQSNIAKFGGDPNNVSIFGESAGAMCVFLHMLSPMSNGLFHKAIAQSGTYELATTTGAKERAFRAGKLLGKDTSDVNELLSFFRNLKADRLTNLTIATFTANETYRGLIAKFLPVVEKKFSGVESFLDEDPTKLILEGKLNRVPFMLGYNSGEGIIVVKYHISLLDIYNNDPSLYVPKEIYEKVSPKQLLDFGRRIKNFFVSGRNITDKDLSIIRDIHTDIFFAYTTHRLAYLYTSLCKETYMYRFDLVTELNIIKSDLGLTNLEGVSHFEDIFYMFNNNFNQELYKEKQEIRDVVYKVTKLWTNFAKTGRPTPDKSLEAMWQPYTVSGKEYFKIDQPFALDHYADRRRMKFWNELYKEAGLLHISDK